MYNYFLVSRRKDKAFFKNLIYRLLNKCEKKKTPNFKGMRETFQRFEKNQRFNP